MKMFSVSNKVLRIAWMIFVKILTLHGFRKMRPPEVVKPGENDPFGGDRNE